MLSSSHRLTILLSHLNIKSLRRYHLMVKRNDQALYDQLPTKSLKTLKAFHSKDASSLASRLLQSAEKTVFEKGMTTSRETVWKILNQEQFTIDNEWSDQQLRLEIVAQFRDFIKHLLLSVHKL